MLKGSLKLVKVDHNYCDYLRKFDSKVPYNYYKKELRPFIGVLFKVNDFQYFAPLTSPKPKHVKMKNMLDFLLIGNGRLGAINFNNMIPVNEKNITILDLNKKFISKREKQYQELLQNQLFWLNRNSPKIYIHSKKLYKKYITGKLNKKIAERCCNFKLLEEKCEEYNKNYV